MQITVLTGGDADERDVSLASGCEVGAALREKGHDVVVFDTVYNPENTLLIKHARSQGCPAVTGVEMFVRQAVLQFNLFTGQSAPDDLMRTVLKRATGAAKV